MSVVDHVVLLFQSYMIDNKEQVRETCPCKTMTGGLTSRLEECLVLMEWI